MPYLSKHLFIQRSFLPSGGQGLFTGKPIRKGERIIEYKGTIPTWKQVDHREGSNGYIYYINRNHVLDAFNYKKALGRYANDARGLGRIKGIRNNAVYKNVGLRVYIDATEDIPAGSEILVGYGREYWEAIRHNGRKSVARSRRKIWSGTGSCQDLNIQSP